MEYSSTWRTGAARSDDRRFPAYGPVEAVLGYAMFYVVVDRVTPAVVTVFSETVLDLSPSLVGLGLASALWFVFALTVVDQARRQLVALGVLADTGPPDLWSRLSLPPVSTGWHLVATVAGGAVAALTFEAAMAAVVALIPVVATVDVAAFVPGQILALLAFFVSYGVATRSLDRVAVRGVRALLSG